MSELKSIFDRPSSNRNPTSIKQYFSSKNNVHKLLDTNLTPVQSKYGMEFDDCREFEHKKETSEISNHFKKSASTDSNDKLKRRHKKRRNPRQKKRNSGSDYDSDSDSDHGAGLIMNAPIAPIQNSSDNLISLNQIVNPPQDLKDLKDSKDFKVNVKNALQESPEMNELHNFKKSPSPLIQLTDIFGPVAQRNTPAQNIVYINEGAYSTLTIEPGKTYIGTGNVQYTNVEISTSLTALNITKPIVIENLIFRTHESLLTKDLVSLSDNKSSITFRNCSFINSNPNYAGNFKLGNTQIRFHNCDFSLIVSKESCFELYSTNLKASSCTFNITYNQNRNLAEMTLFSCKQNIRSSNNCYLSLTSNIFDVFTNTNQNALSRTFNIVSIESDSSISVFSNMFKFTTNKPILLRQVNDLSSNSIVRFLSNNIVFQNSSLWSVSPVKTNSKSQICVKDDYVPYNITKTYENGYDHCDIYINNSYTNIKHIKLTNAQVDYSVKTTDRVIILDNATNSNSTVSIKLPEASEMSNFVDVAGNKNINLRIIGSNGKVAEMPLNKPHRIVPSLSENYIIL